MMKADHVESVRKQELQEALRPALTRQTILHLDSPLTIQAKRGLLSSLSNTAEDLQYWVVSNCWWLAADAPTLPVTCVLTLIGSLSVISYTISSRHANSSWKKRLKGSR